MRPVVVTIVRDRLEHLARQRAWLACSTTTPVHVVVVMGGADPADVLAGPGPPVVRRDLEVGPGEPLPLAAARNLGVATARDHDGDPIVLLDVDVLPLPEAVAAYTDAAARWPADVLLGPVRHLRCGDRPRSPSAWDEADPDPRRPPSSPQVLGRPELLWSLNVAVRPGTWQALGGFHEEYLGWGAEDTDLGMTAHARGRMLRWCPGARGLHQWHAEGDGHDRAADLVRNALTFHQRWGWWPARDRIRQLAEDGLVTFDPRAGVLELT